MKFVLTGGGTAGHINPALALAEILQECDHEVFFAGTPQGVEARLVGQTDIPFVAFEASVRAIRRDSACMCVRSAWCSPRHDPQGQWYLYMDGPACGR